MGRGDEMAVATDGVGIVVEFVGCSKECKEGCMGNFLEQVVWLGMQYGVCNIVLSVTLKLMKSKRNQ